MNDKDITELTVEEIEKLAEETSRKIDIESASTELTLLPGMNPLLKNLTHGREIMSLSQYASASIIPGTPNISPQRAVMLKGFYEQRVETEAVDIPYRVTSYNTVTYGDRATVVAPAHAEFAGLITDLSGRAYLFYDVPAKPEEMSLKKRNELAKEGLLEDHDVVKRVCVVLHEEIGNNGKYRFAVNIEWDTIHRWMNGKLTDKEYNNEIVIKSSPVRSKFNNMDIMSYGVNTNAIFTMDQRTEEDPVVISTSYARKNVHYKYETLTLEIPSRINIETKPVTYNALGEPTDMYSVGDIVPAGAILFGGTIGQKGDMTKIRGKLSSYFTLEDEYIRTLKGGEVHSIEVESSDSNKPLNTTFASPGLRRLFEEKRQLKQDLVDSYNQILTKVDEGTVILSDSAHLIYTDALAYLKERTKLYGDTYYFRLKITLRLKQYLRVGSKITTTAASKGMVDDIVPDEYMPIDADGIRAEIIIPASSVPNRMNPDNVYENEVSGATHRLNLYVRKIDRKQSKANLLKALEPVRTHYQEVMLVTPTDEELLSLLNEKVIPMIIDPTNSDTNPVLNYDIVRRLQKSPFKPSNVVTEYNDMTGESHTIRGTVGSNYMLILNKSPDEYTASSAVIHSNLLLPAQPSKSIRNKVGVNPKPLKLFSAVESLLTIALMGPEYVQTLRHLAVDAETIKAEVKSITKAETPFMVTNEEEIKVPYSGGSALSLTKSIINSGGNNFAYKDVKPLLPKDVKDGKWN